jgi:hypothetical protein
MDKESGVKERKESTNKTNMASLRVIFVTDSLVLGTDFFRLLRFSPVSFFPPIICTNVCLHVAITRRESKRSL